jgi:hypothetical protein
MSSGRLSNPSRLLVSDSNANPNLVEITSCSRMGTSASPTICSLTKRAVGLSGVEECDAEIDGGANQRDGCVLVCGRSEVGAEAHAAETECRDLEVGAEQSSVHRVPFCGREFASARGPAAGRKGEAPTQPCRRRSGRRRLRRGPGAADGYRLVIRSWASA